MDTPPRAPYLTDGSFEETLRRHATKPQADEYGEAEMRAWYRPHDYVPGLGERCIAEATPFMRW